MYENNNDNKDNGGFDSNITLLEITQCTANDGVKWLAQSFSLFSKNPSIWVVIFIVNIVINLVLTRIPYLTLLPTLIAPLFSAGYIYGAKMLDEGQKLEIDHLFVGFKMQLRNLFRLGLLYFLIYMLIFAIFSLVFGIFADDNALKTINQATTTEELQGIITQSPDLINSLLKALIVSLVLSIPMVMASWFAPALVLLNRISPARAMLLSIQACNKNWLAFTVYGVLIIPLMMLAMIPLGLGLLILMPVLFISQYCTYKAIFTSQDNSQGTFTV